MFDDPQKELKKLEEQLLKQEMNDEEFERFYQDIFEEFGPVDEEAVAPVAPKQPVKKAPKPSTYADTPRAVAPKKKKGVKGLVITVCLESIGIIALTLYWVLQIF